MRVKLLTPTQEEFDFNIDGPVSPGDLILAQSIMLITDKHPEGVLAIPVGTSVNVIKTSTLFPETAVRGD